MTIRETFPFDSCERCPDCILDVETINLYGNGSLQGREITVGCKNGTLCIRQYNRLQKEQRMSKNPNCMGLGYDACETCDSPCPYR